jgi:serine protease
VQFQDEVDKRATLIKNLHKTFPNLFISESINYQGSTIGILNQIILKPKAKDTQAIIQRFGSALKLIKKSKYNTYLFEISSTSNPVNLANRIQESGLVEFSQPNFLGGIKQTNPLYPDQYYLNNTGQVGGTPGIDINAPEAWNITQGCGNVRVAVIDDGVADHEDIGGRLANGFDPLFPANLGRPFTANDNHGTPCAGIIGAGNSLLGIRGIASNATLVPVKIFNNGNSYAGADIADAIDWAWDDGDADILSNSWGGAIPDAAITTAINNALTLGRGGLGCVVVAASGNDWPLFNFVSFPANINNVITVGAIDKSGNIFGYSQRGIEMDLVAPSGLNGGSGDVRTTDRPGADGYDAGNYSSTFGGTSAACPQVAGVAALMLSVNPNLTEAQVRTFLQQTATDMGASGFDNTFGFGRVNAEAAVIRALGGPIVGPDRFCSTASYSLTGTAFGSVNWIASGAGINSSTGDATMFYDGFGQVGAQLATGCGTVTLSRPISTGAPNPAYIFAEAWWIGSGLGYKLSPSGNTQVEAGYNYDPIGANSILEYQWNITDHTNWYVTPLTTTSVELNYWSLPNPTSQKVYIRGRNSCGWGAYQETTWEVSFFAAKYSVSPNPASDYVTLLFEDLVDSKGLPELVELLSENSTTPIRSLSATTSNFESVKNNNNKLSIPVSDLPRGTYFLHVSYGGKKNPDKHRVVLK